MDKYHWSLRTFFLSTFAVGGSHISWLLPSKQYVSDKKWETKVFQKWPGVVGLSDSVTVGLLLWYQVWFLLDDSWIPAQEACDAHKGWLYVWSSGVSFVIFHSSLYVLLHWAFQNDSWYRNKISTSTAVFGHLKIPVIGLHHYSK